MPKIMKNGIEYGGSGGAETIKDTGIQLVDTISGTNRIYSDSRTVSSSYLSSIKSRYRYLLVELLAGTSNDFMNPINSLLFDTNEMTTDKFSVQLMANNVWVDLNKFVRLQWTTRDINGSITEVLYLINSDTTGSALYIRGIIKGIN